MSNRFVDEIRVPARAGMDDGLPAVQELPEAHEMRNE